MLLEALGIRPGRSCTHHFDLEVVQGRMELVHDLGHLGTQRAAPLTEIALAILADMSESLAGLYEL